MTWINKITTPEVKQKVSLYTYETEAAIYPQYTWGYIADYNPNLYSNNDTIQVDGQTIPISVDFTGVATYHLRLGDGGDIYCNSGTCQQTPWPRCNAQWNYSKTSDQATCQSNGCDRFDGDTSCWLNSFRTFDFARNRFRQPIRTINPFEPDKARYWNNINLWNNAGFIGNVLLEHDGIPYKDGGEEYVMTVGHAITTAPCSGSANFFFLDPDTKNLIYRRFICPCVAWNTSVPENDVYGNPALCGGLDEPLTNDGYRLWVMERGQEPLPDSLKRYKMLSNKVRDGFPTYGFHNTHIVTKAIIKKNENGILVGKPDRNIPESFGVNSDASWQEIQNQSYYWDFSYYGQGDDGQAQFTVTPDGETIFIGWHTGYHGGYKWKELTVPYPPIAGPGKCNSSDDLFVINPATNSVEHNTWCLPDLYHPELVIPNYPNYDPVELITLTRGILDSADDRLLINKRLEQLGKPKIVLYTFPEHVTVNETPFVPEIDFSIEEKYPLIESPYLSRESKNSLYQNANSIFFEEKRMLQASELNELQEKFYRKQSLFTIYCKNWLKNSTLKNSNNLDILGTNTYNPLQLDIGDRLCKITPINENQLSFTRTNINTIHVTAYPGWYLINSNVRLVNIDDFDNPTSVSSSNSIYSDFIHIKNELYANVDISSLQNNEKIISAISVDMTNIISCADYADLLDNSGGSNENSPCGAKRNVLVEKQLYFEKIPTTTTQGISEISYIPSLVLWNALNQYYSTRAYKSPLNQYASAEFPVNHLFTYTVRTANTIKTYSANNVLISQFNI